MTTFTATLIALFLSLGIIDAPADVDNLTVEQQEQIDSIIIPDETGE